MIYPGDLALQLGLTSAFGRDTPYGMLIIWSWCDAKNESKNAHFDGLESDDRTAVAQLWKSYGMRDITRNHREVFTRERVIRVGVGFPFLRIVISLKNSLHSVNQLGVEPKPWLTDTRFPTRLVSYKYLIGSLDCGCPLWLAELILRHLKGLGHCILGNFSTNQMAVEFTKISKKRLRTWEELKQDTGKPRRDIIWVNLKNVGPPFFSNLYQFI